MENINLVILLLRKRLGTFLLGFLIVQFLQVIVRFLSNPLYKKGELKNEKKIQFNQKDGWKMLF